MLRGDLTDPELASGTSHREVAVAVTPRPFGSDLAARLFSFVGDDPMKVVRYGVTSCVALGISEVTLLVLSARGVGAAPAALFANLAGTGPSYLLSRYWIWSGADRDRATRQVLAYWLVSFVSMAISSLLTGAVGLLRPHRHLLHLAVLGAAYLIISLVLWIAKYLVYETAIFRTGPIGAS